LAEQLREGRRRGKNGPDHDNGIPPVFAFQLRPFSMDLAHFDNHFPSFGVQVVDFGLALVKGPPGHLAWFQFSRRDRHVFPWRSVR